MGVKYDGICSRKLGHLLDNFCNSPGFTRAGITTYKGMTLEEFVAVEIGNYMLSQCVFT